jgi:hypothetical protein
MIILLTVLSALAVLAFVLVLTYYLFRIALALEDIGGHPNSYLGKINWGVGAIECETSHLEPQVGHLNEALTTLVDKLSVVDQHLRASADALSTGKEAGS